jgi:CubicO group peptidase (beta-lactamase class C family)
MRVRRAIALPLLLLALLGGVGFWVSGSTNGPRSFATRASRGSARQETIRNQSASIRATESASEGRGPLFDSKTADELIAAALQKWEVPGAAVVIVRGDEVIYLKGHGVRELGGKKPVTPDTVFPLSSCSKAFTTLALAMLVDRGKVAWDDPVSKHLPAFRLADPLANENVTLRDLLCHRTGLDGHDLLWYHAPWGLEEQVRRLGQLKLSYSFRSTFKYQNVAVAAGGLAAAAASGKSWADFVQTEILTPLQMTRTTLTTTEAFKAKDRSSGHRRNRAGKVETIAWHPFAAPHPALSVNSTARDLGQWLRFQLGDGTWGADRLVSAANLRETHLPQMIIPLKGQARREQPYTTQLSYGLAWVIQDYRGHRLVSHAGNLDGFRAHITLAPDDGIGLVILANVTHTRMNMALNNSLLDLLFEVKSPKDWNGYYLPGARAREDGLWATLRERQRLRRPNTKPSRDLDAYGGTYENPAYGTARIGLEKERLVWRWSSFQIALEHYHFDTFTAPSDLLMDPLLTFRLGPDGEVVSFRFEGMDFNRVKK